NSEVKRTRANDSVRFPHVKVGHRQGFIILKRHFHAAFFFFEYLFRYQKMVGLITIKCFFQCNWN
ncbi:hypothetical protein, partial [Legionella steigerwaltii]|uniref:hypothetical protein n=1 Tax=Legionella steigerwaltii TaxID=460 RepID=UPI00073078E7